MKALFRVNKLKKGAKAVLGEQERQWIQALDLTMERTSAGYGGLEVDDLSEMAENLMTIRTLHIRMNEQVRLVPVKPMHIDYIPLLARFAFDATLGHSSLQHLSIVNTTPEPFQHVLQLVSRLPKLKTLLVDNVSAAPAYNGVTANDVDLPDLVSFKLQNSPEIVVSPRSGFNFLMRTDRLVKPALTHCRVDRDFLLAVLGKQHIVDLELGTPSPPGSLDRRTLMCLYDVGAWSWDTGIYPPIEALRNLSRLGNEGATVCRSLKHLTLGGAFCVSPALFDILQEAGREPLITLKLFNAWPLRPLRPSTDPLCKEEAEAITANPSGIAPDNLLGALTRGFRVQRLELVGMGEEWDTVRESKAREVAAECERLGIGFVMR